MRQAWTLYLKKRKGLDRDSYVGIYGNEAVKGCKQTLKGVVMEAMLPAIFGIDDLGAAGDDCD